MVQELLLIPVKNEPHTRAHGHTHTHTHTHTHMKQHSILKNRKKYHPDNNDAFHQVIKADRYKN